MAKWMIISTHPYHEIKGSVGGFLSKLKVDLFENNLKFVTEDRPYVLYVITSAEESNEKGFINEAAKFREILEVSNLLEFNYKVLMTGREYYNKLENLDVISLANLIQKEIRFVKPEWLFIPSSDSNDSYISVDSRQVNKACQILIKDVSKFKYNVPNVLEYSTEFYNDVDYFIQLDRKNKVNSVDLLYDASSLYESRLRTHPHCDSWELNYYRLSLYGSLINTDFAEGFKVKRISNDSRLLSLLNLQVEDRIKLDEINEKEIKLEEIL